MHLKVLRTPIKQSGLYKVLFRFSAAGGSGAHVKTDAVATSHDHHEADHHDEHHDHHAHGHGHHHHKEYDWRDDPKVNKDLYDDVRGRGWNPENYTFPYEGRDDWYFINHPKELKIDQLTHNLRPEFKPSTELNNTMTANEWSMEGDIAHEYDYESEDLDFQPESIKMQHYRKKGPIWGYFILGCLPIIYFFSDFIYQNANDEDSWRISRPPPLNYPDIDDTDDTDTYQDYHSRTGRLMKDTGLVGDLWFDIVDGKKVYRRFSGVNQPMDDI